DKVVKNFRRKTRQAYLPEDKIRIVLAGSRGGDSIAVLYSCKGGAESLYYSWSKEFLEAGQRWLSGDTVRQATSPEVKKLRSEFLVQKGCVAELTLNVLCIRRSAFYR
ncbi:MAG: IS3 family transposase, partial [Paracoccaceae bacterium]